MIRMARPMALLALVLALGACSGMNRQTQRALSGGAIGAVAGGAIAAIAGGPILAGAALGGAGGAAIGAFTH